MVHHKQMQIQCLYETGVSPHFANEANVITLLSVYANYVTSKAKNALQRNMYSQVFCRIVTSR